MYLLNKDLGIVTMSHTNLGNGDIKMNKLCMMSALPSMHLEEVDSSAS